MNTAHYKADLLAKKDEYEARIAKIINHLHNPDSELNEHWDDQAIIARQNDMRKNLLLEAENGLEQINNALLRMDNGVYGQCAECGEAIETERLEAVPTATRCIAHSE